ncbi:hypothetical protein Ndes2526B_g07743 [Nannochloris sp. 'desiccata']
MSQKAVVLHAGPSSARKATEVSVPQPSGQPGSVHPPEYIEFLPGADPDHLLAADCPFSQLTGKHVVVIYDSRGKGQPNPCASRLTTNVENGLEIEVKGDALVLYALHNTGFGIQQWSELDNVIYDELLEFFGQGLKPQKVDIDRLVKDFKSGKFNYPVDDGKTGDEDANKDDGSLPGWG